VVERKPWTREEDDALRACYRMRRGAARAAALARALPGRTWSATMARASKIGAGRGHRAWRPEDDARLRRLWHDVSERALRAAFRGRTWCAIRTRAIGLGLPLGIPQGYETLRAAAARTGFCPKTLRPLLEAAGVPLYVAYRGDAPGERAIRTRYVEPDAVDAAVCARLGMETVKAAAERRGIYHATLDARLRRMGLLAGPWLRGRPRWLPSDVIDQACAGYTPRPRARKAA
jgi:hypothetical protein